MLDPTCLTNKDDQPLIQQTPIPLTNWTFLNTTLVVIALGHIVNDEVCKQSSGTWDAQILETGT